MTRLASLNNWCFDWPRRQSERIPVHSLDILARLIAFDTTSRNSNMELIAYVSDLLRTAGLLPQLVPNSDNTKANLFVTAGPNIPGGVLLSGHSDVVPVDGQNWTKPPFTLTKQNNNLYGRGTADMKGFVACAIAAMLAAARRPLKTPLHLALSYDEEIGCLGVRSLIDQLAQAPFKPRLCIVGEPTEMAVATGHKGKTALHAICTGQEGHSALAPNYVNALHLAIDLVEIIRAEQTALQGGQSQDTDYDIPYSTLHVGKIHGGETLNIVPNRCDLHFEIRNVATDQPTKILDRIKAKTAAIVRETRKLSTAADVTFEITNSYPGLDTPSNSDAVHFVKSPTGANATIKVAYGTEGGLFSERLGIQTVICGPGSMAQGHRPDEFVTADQLGSCVQMLDHLLDRLS